MPVIATLGVVVALLSLILFGTFSALLIIVHKYYKKGTQLLLYAFTMVNTCWTVVNVLIIQVELTG